MKIRIVMPEQAMGDVIGDLNSRRAVIADMGDEGHLKFVSATVPLDEILGYAHAFRSMTLGRASFTIEPSGYVQLPYPIYQARENPHGTDEPPAASAGRPVLPTRPKPGISGSCRRPMPPEN